MQRIFSKMKFCDNNQEKEGRKTNMSDQAIGYKYLAKKTGE